MENLSLAFSPLLPWPALIALAGLAIVVLALGFFTRRPGTLLRALAMAMILGALTDPALVREDREDLKDVVAIVVDQTGSQTIGERMAQTLAARTALEASLGQMSNVEPRFIEAGKGDAQTDGTRLFAALNAGLADVPPERIGAVILITDGLVHDIPASLDAYGIKAPLHALITGHEGERDRRIELVEGPRFGIVGKDQVIVARVLDTAPGNEPIVLHVRRDGVEISRLQVSPGTNIRVPVRIDHGGPNLVELEVETLPGELTALNNRAVLTIEGVRDKLKVLLVSGEPHAGERMWRNLLKSDANVDLVHFTILRPPDKNDQTPNNELALIAFPVADLFGTKIKEFDLIIFDRYSNQSVLPQLYFENIVRYVRDGGALLLAAGPDFAKDEGLFNSPLGRISPAKPDGRVLQQPFRATITIEGARHPVTRDLPGSAASPPGWSDWYRQVEADVLRGNAVMAGVGDKPLLVLSREAKGRVGLLLSDQMWLWARDYQGGGPHLDLLRRLAHWLMKEPELEEEALRASALGREITIERQSLKPEVGDVTLTTPTGTTSVVKLDAASPGLSRAKISVDEPGLYRLTDGALSALVNVGAENPREFQEVVSTPEYLRALAQASGGSVRRIASPTGIIMPRITSLRNSPSYAGSDFIAIHRTGVSTVKALGVAPLAIGLLGLALLLGSILAAWIREARRGSEFSA